MKVSKGLFLAAGVSLGLGITYTSAPSLSADMAQGNQYLTNAQLTDNYGNVIDQSEVNDTPTYNYPWEFTGSGESDENFFDWHKGESMTQEELDATQDLMLEDYLSMDNHFKSIYVGKISGTPIAEVKEALAAKEEAKKVEEAKNHVEPTQPIDNKGEESTQPAKPVNDKGEEPTETVNDKGQETIQPVTPEKSKGKGEAQPTDSTQSVKDNKSQSVATPATPVESDQPVTPTKDNKEKSVVTASNKPMSASNTVDTILGTQTPKDAKSSPAAKQGTLNELPNTGEAEDATKKAGIFVTISLLMSGLLVLARRYKK